MSVGYEPLEGGAALQDLLSGMADRASDWTPAFGAIIESFHSIESRRFAGNGPGWLPLAESTISMTGSWARQNTNYDQILVDTGVMQALSRWWRRSRRGMDAVLDRHVDHRPLRPLAPDGWLPLARLGRAGPHSARSSTWPPTELHSNGPASSRAGCSKAPRLSLWWAHDDRLEPFLPAGRLRAALHGWLSRKWP